MSSKKPPVEGSLKGLGYDWIKVKNDDVGKDLVDILNKNNAECYILDVYTSGNQVYRNISCTLEEEPQHNFETELRILYNRETGKNVVISKDIKK